MYKGESVRRSSLDMEVLNVFIASDSRELERLVITFDPFSHYILMWFIKQCVHPIMQLIVFSSSTFPSSLSSFGPMLIDYRIPLQRCVFMHVFHSC